MDLKQMAYFVRVAELGSFTRASISLDIAQPALSRQVRNLEVELRHNLLLRNGRGVTLTETGQLVLEQFRGILREVQRVKEDLGRMPSSLAGKVVVGMPPSIARQLTVPLTRAFARHLPAATLTIVESLSHAQQEALVAGRLDIAMLYNPRPSPEVDSEVLLEEDLYLLSATGSGVEPGPIGLEDVAARPLIMHTRPNAIRMLLESEMAALGYRPRVAMEIDGVSAMLDLVIEGIGQAVLAKSGVSTSVRRDFFIAQPIVQPRVKSRLALAVSSQRPITRTQQAVLALMREVALATL